MEANTTLTTVNTTQAASLLRLSTQRVRQLLAAGRIKGAFKKGRFWQIPLFNGMPKVETKKKGPRGTWRKRPPAPIYIHVNQNQIQKNNKHKTTEPVIIVHQGNKSILCNEVEIPDFGKFTYQPNKPKSCGARLWFDVNSGVKLNIS